MSMGANEARNLADTVNIIYSRAHNKISFPFAFSFSATIITVSIPFAFPFHLRFVSVPFLLSTTCAIKRVSPFRFFAEVYILSRNQ